MPKIVISDTSCLILFHKIGEFDLLKKVYVDISTTPEVAEEFVELLPKWIKIESVKDKKYQSFLETQVDLVKQVRLHLLKKWMNPYFC